MAINRGMDRFLPTLNGNVLLSGGSLNLAKGQLGIFSTKEQTRNGLKAYSSFAGVPKNREFEIRVGQHPVAVTRTGDNKAKATRAFRLDEIEEIRVHAPSLEQKVDDFIVGYDGINPDSALTFEPGDNEELDIELSGEAIGLMGYVDAKANVKVHFTLEDAVGCDVASEKTNQQIVEEAIERLRETTLIGGVKLTNFVDIIPVNSEATSPTGVSHTFYTLSVNCANGSNTLGDIQAQYNEDKVVDLGGGKYGMLRATLSGAPSDYVQTTTRVQRPCADCPDGYEGYDSGLLYSVQLEDDGSDATSTVETLAGAVADSATKIGQVAGFGNYYVVLDDKATDDEIESFLESNPTAIIEFVSNLGELCVDTDTTSISWVAGDVCYASEDKYTLQLADDCGGSRLAELQEAYPDLSITTKDSEGTTTTITITLTGGSGAATISFGEDDFLVTFNDDLATTASDFVDSHAEDLKELGITVVASDDTLTFTANTEDYVLPTISNDSGNLNGSVGEPTETPIPVAGGCQTVYETTVITNIVCEDCDPIFTDLFVSEAPEPFEMVDWVKEAKTYSDTALMGIRFRGKKTILAPDESTKDGVPFYNSSVKLRVAGGYATETYNTFTTGRKRFAVKILSKWEDLENLGGNLWAFEDRDFTYFNGYPRHRNPNGFQNEFAKQILGEESLLKANSQYVIYTVKVSPRTSQGAVVPNKVETFNYMIAVEVGKHTGVENLLNGLAGAVGLPAVKAY